MASYLNDSSKMHPRGQKTVRSIGEGEMTWVAFVRRLVKAILKPSYSEPH